MADSDLDLEAIRAQRMAELQGQLGQGGQGQTAEQQREQQMKQKEMKNNLLTQVLDQAARARLNSIALIKPEKAEMLESMIINMAKSRGLQQKITEDQLKQLLEQVSQQTQKKTRVTYRRRDLDDSD